MILVRRSASVRLAQPSDFGCTNRGQGAWEGPGISHAGSQDPNGHPGPLASVWTRTQCDSWCPGSSATCRLQKSLDGAADSVKWTFVKPEGRTASCLSPTPEGRVPVAGQRAVLAAPPNKRSPRTLSLPFCSLLMSFWKAPDQFTPSNLCADLARSHVQGRPCNSLLEAECEAGSQGAERTSDRSSHPLCHPDLTLFLRNTSHSILHRCKAFIPPYPGFNVPVSPTTAPSVGRWFYVSSRVHKQ